MSNRIRILHLLNSGEYGGAENVVISIIKKTKDICDSAYASPDGYITSCLLKEKIKWLEIRQNSLISVDHVIRHFDPDIIHAHDYTMSVYAALASKKVPIISHLHHNPPWIKKYGLRSLVYNANSKKYKKVLVVSKSIVEEYVFGNSIIKKTLVIGNPIDREEIIKRSAEGSIIRNNDVIFVGRLHKAKNPLGFINIINKVRKELPYISAVMVGDGELKDEVESSIYKLNLDNCIELAGFQENPYLFLKNAKVLCMPSKWEGFGLAAVEALALGVPVICANVGGLPSIVDDSCGRICETEENIADNIIEILRDKELYEKLCNGARKKSIELSNIDEYITRIQGIYQEFA